MPLSIEDSIKKLKAEIIAQDWRLSPKRAAGLEDAFQCLRQRFKNRRATNAMLIMAGSVLEYIKNRGGNPPETIDFLKESMAHVVNLYEDLTFDPEKEELLFAGLFKRFQRLKGRINTGGGSQTKSPSLQPGKDATAPDATTVSMAKAEDTAAPTKVETLIEDLRTSLDKAGEASSAIGKILAEALDSKGLQLADDREEMAVQPRSYAKDPQENKRRNPPRIQDCPATELFEVRMNGASLVIPKENISLVKLLKKKKLHECLQNSQVPLKCFSGFLQKLSRQFSGALANIKDNKLKKVILPIVIPQGYDFAEIPDKLATVLVVISVGNWHGVLACTEITNETCLMQKIEQQKNGDIAGFAHLADDRRVMLLDPQVILRREGFLLMT